VVGARSTRSRSRLDHERGQLYHSDTLAPLSRYFNSVLGSSDFLRGSFFSSSNRLRTCLLYLVDQIAMLNEKSTIERFEQHVPINPSRGSAEDAPTTNKELEKTVTIDTVHNDEAVRVLATYAGDETWTPAEERLVVRKIDRRLLPLLVLTYGLQYYDKAMLSQAAIFGLRADLKLSTGNRYSFSSSIFYLGFVVGATPAIIMAQRFPIERVACVIVSVWGTCLMCTAACATYQALYAQRFFLGVLESGVSPMFMLIVSGFYKKNEQALRMGVWYCATGYVSVFAPLSTFTITSGHRS
jgi:hypothetical protein